MTEQWVQITKRRLSTSHIPILEPVWKPALPSYTIYSDSLPPRTLPSLTIYGPPPSELREFLRYTYIGVRAGGARGAAAPPAKFGQLRFFGQQEKIWAKPVFKDVSMFFIIIT